MKNLTKEKLLDAIFTADGAISACDNLKEQILALIPRRRKEMTRRLFAGAQIYYSVSTGAGERETAENFVGLVNNVMTADSNDAAKVRWLLERFWLYFRRQCDARNLIDSIPTASALAGVISEYTAAKQKLRQS